MLKAKKYILLSVTILAVLFIFVHSLMSADVSSDESGSLLDVFNAALAALYIPLVLTDHIIRKAAHFTEFACYGVLLSWTVLAFYDGFKGQVFKILFFLLSVPVTDETLQYFSEGRSPQVNDILLDFSGAVTGFLLVVLAAAVKSRRNSNKEH